MVKEWLGEYSSIPLLQPGRAAPPIKYNTISILKLQNFLQIFLYVLHIFHIINEFSHFEFELFKPNFCFFCY